MARKEEEQETEQQEEEGQDVEAEESGTSINITEELITVEVPRDGNEADTLNRLAKMVEGLGE